MTMILGVPLPALMGQLVVGLINGSFYAMLSLGLALIFGMLHVINFAHGAFYMLGAFVAYLLLTVFGIGYWPSLLLAPLLVGLGAALLERVVLKRLYRLAPLYGLLLTFGLALVLEGAFRHFYGSSGKPFAIPAALQGSLNLGFMVLPVYRLWVIVVSLVVSVAVWITVERTRFGSSLRAATEDADLVRVLGINVPMLMTLTFTFGCALAAFAGVLAAPIFQVSPLMGRDLIVVVFAVVVIGGMGSMLGAILTGYALGICEGLTRVFYPEASNVVVFVFMALVLLLRPRGLLGKL